MGLLWVLLSVLFLCNPVAGFSDPLPDLFGYLMIWLGLARLADLNGTIAEGRRGFRTMLFVGVGELLIRALLRDAESMQTSKYQQPTWILLFSFVLLLLQCLILIPAFKRLFSGLDALADKHQSTRLSRLTGRGRRQRTWGERMVRITTVFWVAHALLALLPELSILTSFEYAVGNEAFFFDWYQYIGLFRAVGVLISVLFALVWLIAFLLYFITALREREWLERIQNAYACEVLTQVEMLTVRRICTAIGVLSIGVFFTIGLRLDGQVALTSLVFAVAVLFAVWYLGDLLTERGGYYLPCIALAIVSAAHALSKYFYLQRFDVDSSKYIGEAFWFFLVTQFLEILDAALTLAVIWKLFALLLDLARRHVSVDYGTAGSELLSRNATERLHKTFEKRANVTLVVFAVAALGYMFEAILQLRFPLLWILPFLASFVAICMTIGFLHELSGEIRSKYLSDLTNKKS